VVIMTKRGRPSKDGVQPFWMFYRTVLVIQEFNELRSAGMKQSSAITETVDRLRKIQPEMPISRTEVKRILASYQSRGSPISIKVTPLANGPEP
jgi:hypothetical protein